MVMVVRLCYGVVIVAVIVAAQPLVADVTEDQEGRPDHRYTAFTREIEKVVAEDGGDQDETDPDEAVCENTEVSMSAAAESKSDQTRREDDPEQYGMEARVAQQCCCQNGERNDRYGQHQAVNGARRGDEDRHFVAEGLGGFEHFSLLKSREYVSGVYQSTGDNRILQDETSTGTQVAVKQHLMLLPG